MELSHLEYFCTAAATCNISEAARRHHISQPAMSKYMAQLEKELQIPLFIRSGNQIMLSPEGRTFYAHARKILSEYSDAMDTLQSESRQLTIHMQVNTTRQLLVRYLTDFLPEHPQTNVLIDFNLREDALTSSGAGLYHFVIGLNSPYPYQNRSIPLFSERYMLAVPAGHPLADREEASVEDLRNEPILLQSKTRSFGMRLTNLCLDSGFQPQLRAVCNESRYMCELVSAGVGVTLVPEFSWAPLLGSGVRLLPLRQLLGQTLSRSLYWNDNRYQPEEIRQFRDGLVAFYRGTVGRR